MVSQPESTTFKSTTATAIITTPLTSTSVAPSSHTTTEIFPTSSTITRSSTLSEILKPSSTAVHTTAWSETTTPFASTASSTGTPANIRLTSTAPTQFVHSTASTSPVQTTTFPPTTTSELKSTTESLTSTVTSMASQTTGSQSTGTTISSTPSSICDCSCREPDYQYFDTDFNVYQFPGRKKRSADSKIHIPECIAQVNDSSSDSKSYQFFHAIKLPWHYLYTYNTIGQS